MKKKKIISGLALMLSFAMLAGCGDSARSTADTSYYANDAASEDSNSYGTSKSYDASSDYATSDTEADYAAGTAGSDFDNTTDTGSDSSADASSGDATDNLNQDDQKLVYSGDVSIQTLKYDDTMKDLKKLIDDNGGFIENQQENNNNYSWYEDDSSEGGLRDATITARIPSDKFDGFLDSMADLGQVMSKSSSTENITKTYNDNDAQIEALQKEEQRLLDMMDKSSTVDEMISVEKRLTEVETELNQANSDKSSMDSDIAYSTVTVYVDEVKKYSEISTPDKYSEKLVRALKNSWVYLLKFFQGFLLMILYILPFAVVIVAAIFIIKAIRKKKGKPSNKKQEKPVNAGTVENKQKDNTYIPQGSNNKTDK